MSPDVHALTGAYVLDAVSDLERASFERHLAECDACAAEVRELRETATRLGQAATAEPPAHLRAKVLSAIKTVRQLPPEVPMALGRHRASPRWALRLSTAAAAVLLVVASVLGVLLLRERDSANDARTTASALSALLQSGDARVASGTAAAGGAATVVYSRSQDRALVLANGMPAVSPGKDYEAWVIGADDHLRPAGLLPHAGSATLNLTDIATAKGFGVTVEPAGGSTTPTLPPIMTVTFAA
jgi:anti-sigma-K factor RskA